MFKSLIRSFFLLLALFFLVAVAWSQPGDVLQYVNPFIGTDNSESVTRWGSEGGTYPGAVAPFGYVQLTPETSTGDKKGYYYRDTTLYFFSSIHHRSGYPNGSSGQLRIMPVREPGVPLLRSGRPFSHRQEKATPGYYSVLLSDDSTLIEATALERAGMFRFTFRPGVVPHIFVGYMGTITKRSERLLEGKRFNAMLRFSEDIRSMHAVDSGYVLSFAPSGTAPAVITLALGVSGVSMEGTQKNLDATIGARSFDEVWEQARESWQKELSVITINPLVGAAPDVPAWEGGTQEKTIFYTALYHSLLLPWIISDVDGNYQGRDGKVHHTTGAQEYGGFSPWDTYRTLHPLLCLLFPQRQNDMVRSLLDAFDQTGYLPVDPMTGNHSVPIIVDSYLKGVNNFDSARAYAAMKKSIDVPPFVQQDLAAYQRQGYLPLSYAESVTRTVEYAYDDWALAQFAGSVMRYRDDHQRLLQRGYSYRSLFHPESLFMLPRQGNTFNTAPGTSGYKEGDPWVYTYAVPHEVTDLINLMGGNEAFTTRLDSALVQEKILFDNETVFHVPYLFNYAGHPENTQQWVSTIMRGRYKNTPGGLPGNDDLGSMSSWYVFSAMGIFPVAPGRPVYTLGTPLFRSLTIHLANGKTFTITNRNPSPQNRYVRSVLLDKKKYKQLRIPHARILEGGELLVGTDRIPGKWFNDKPGENGEEVTGSPIFTVHNPSLSKTVVKPDEVCWIRFSLSNKGSVGTRAVRLTVDGKVHSIKNCLVGKNSTITDSISCRLYSLGKVRLKIDGLKTLEVMVTDPGLPMEAQRRVEALSVKPVLMSGEAQRISYVVQNTGWQAHTFAIPLLLDGVQLNVDSIRLRPGERKTVSQESILRQPGFHTLRVHDQEARFKVCEQSRDALVAALSLRNTGRDGVTDSSGFHNDGVIVETDPAPKDRSGHYITLDKDRYIELPNSPSLDVTGETLTMMAWVYARDSGGGLSDILTKGDNHVLQVHGKQHMLNFFAGGWGRGECAVNLPQHWLNTWHHIAGVCDGASLRVYIDGILAGTTPLGAPVNLSVTAKWTLGRNEEFPSERIFTGLMDQVKIFSSALSAEEIKAIVEDHPTHPPASP